jgi:hypothetical protein
MGCPCSAHAASTPTVPQHPSTPNEIRSFDHLVNHAAVKCAYVELRERVNYLQRLAFYTITEEEVAQFEWVHLTGSKTEDIDVEAMHRALDCCVTYAVTIEAHQDGSAGARQNSPREVVSDIYPEEWPPERAIPSAYSIGT